MMSSLTSAEAAGLDYEEVERHLQTNVKTGLDHAEASRRLAFHGSNDFEISKDDPLWKKYIGQVSLYAVRTD